MIKNLLNAIKGKVGPGPGDIRKELKTLQQIGDSITVSLYFCYNNTLPFVKSAETNSPVKMQLYYEYLYLFRHLVLREAFTQLPIDKMRIVHEYIAETYIPIAVSSFLAQKLEMPETKVRQLRIDFLKKIDQMEVYYSAFKNIFGDDNALMPKVGHRIAGLIDFSDSSVIIDIISQAYRSMNLADLITQVDNDVLSKGTARQYIAR